VRHVVSVCYYRVSSLEKPNALAQIGAVVGDDLFWHADAPSQILQAFIDVNAGAVGGDAQVENHDLMMLQRTGVSLEVVQGYPNDQQAFLLADPDGVVENPHPVVAPWHTATEQEQATTQQPGPNRLVVGEAQRQRIAKEADEAEQNFANPTQADVGVEIPTQAEANDQQRVAMADRRRQVGRGKLSAARAFLRSPCRRKFRACLFESGTQSGDLFGPLTSDMLPVIAAFREIADGDAEFLNRSLLGSRTLLPGIPAAAKQPRQMR
jgi:hypothetical protein